VCSQLVSCSDVVVENLRPDALASWGLGFECLRDLNPDVVLLSVSGYGRTGPLAHHLAYASNVGNFIGLTEVWGPDGTYLDFVAGVHGVSALLAALAHARRTAAAVNVDLAETEAGASVLAPLYLTALDVGETPGRNELSASILSAVVRCAGHDSWLAVEIEDDSDYQVLCEFLERPDLCGPDRGRHEVGSLVEALETWAARISPLQAAWRLQGAGLAAGPVQTAEDLWRDPQHRSRHAFVEIEHPDVGTFEYPGPVGRIGRTPARVRRRAPRLGEHTGEVLREWLGLPDATVDEYLASGAVWQG
jgi:benzylsuccinate CoA-transferase BbsF subunit